MPTPPIADPYDASVTISNGLATITSNFTVMVACQLNLSKLAPKLNFAKTNSDSCTVMGAFESAGQYQFRRQAGDAGHRRGSLTFTLPSKGTRPQWPEQVQHADLQQEDRPVETQCLVQERFLANRLGQLQHDQFEHSEAGMLVSDLPVILLLDTEAFMATTNLHYTATQGKSGAAK